MTAASTSRSSDDMPARFRAERLACAGGGRTRYRGGVGRHPAGQKGPAPVDDRLPTVIGRGLPGVEGTRAAHSGRIRYGPGGRRAPRYLDWPHPRLRGSRKTSCARGGEAGRRSLPDYEAWQARVAALRAGQAPAARPPARRAACRRAGRRRCAPSARALRRSGRHSTGIKLSGEIVDRSCRGHPGTDLPARRTWRARRSTSAALAAVHRGGPRRPLRPLRHPRARDGRDDERHGGPWRRRAGRRHLPGVLRLPAAGAAHGGA